MTDRPDDLMVNLNAHGANALFAQRRAREAAEAADKKKPRGDGARGEDEGG
jgi:hypothetical protein